MELDLLVKQNLADDFILDGKSKKVRLAPSKNYLLPWVEGIRSGRANYQLRHNLLAKSDIGVIHLDFIATSAEVDVVTLPENAPVPVNLIEAQVFNGGIVSLEKDSRVVKAKGIPIGKRVVVDLIGQFK